MFEKKKNYAQGEMRPLSALSQKKGEGMSARKTVLAQVPISPQVQNTVSALSGQNKIAEGDTAQRTPIRAAAAAHPERIPPTAPEKKTEYEEQYTSPEVQTPPPVRNPMRKAGTGLRSGQRTEREPDLSRQEEWEAFFSQLFTEDVRRRRSTGLAPDISHKEETQTPPAASLQSTNPFRNRPIDRPVISHAKEEPESVPSAAVQNEPIVEEQSADAPPAEMAMSIEQAFSAKRRREEKNNMPPEPSPEETKARRRSAYIRAVILMGILTVGGLFLLLGGRSVFSDEESNETAQMPEFSMHSYLNGEYTSGLADYYNDTIPMRSAFERAADALCSLKGLELSSEQTEP